MFKFVIFTLRESVETAIDGLTTFARVEPHRRLLTKGTAGLGSRMQEN